MAISGNQLRAARALAGAGQRMLAEKSGVSVNTIRNMEARGEERVRARLETMDRLRDALLDLGVEFIGEDDGRAGVRLLKPSTELLRRRGSENR